MAKPSPEGAIIHAEPLVASVPLINIQELGIQSLSRPSNLILPYIIADVSSTLQAPATIYAHVDPLHPVGAFCNFDHSCCMTKSRSWEAQELPSRWTPLSSRLDEFPLCPCDVVSPQLVRDLLIARSPRFLKWGWQVLTPVINQLASFRVFFMEVSLSTEHQHHCCIKRDFIAHHIVFTHAQTSKSTAHLRAISVLERKHWNIAAVVLVELL
mmetsp:Transcript_2071/g.5263  ORF Transcript_2071/g.5263 Transcript_2071/m.5263 type:complete len:212 (-) Transcript_2071:1051-1686(-)